MLPLLGALLCPIIGWFLWQATDFWVNAARLRFMSVKSKVEVQHFYYTLPKFKLKTHSHLPVIEGEFTKLT